jgi:hypothetical protein
MKKFQFICAGASGYETASNERAAFRKLVKRKNPKTLAVLVRWRPVGKWPWFYQSTEALLGLTK